MARQSFDDLSLNLLYLETVDANAVKPEYAEELLSGIQSSGQMRRVSHYAYYVDPTLSGGEPVDLSILRS